MSENLSNVAAFAACGTTDPKAAPACGTACGAAILGRGFGCAAHANHFVEARVHERLDSAVRQKLPRHLFAASGKEIDGIGLVMNGAHAANLRGAGCVGRCERKRSCEFHFCETSLRVHYEPFYED